MGEFFLLYLGLSSVTQTITDFHSLFVSHGDDHRSPNPLLPFTTFTGQPHNHVAHPFHHIPLRCARGTRSSSKGDVLPQARRAPRTPPEKAHFAEGNGDDHSMYFLKPLSWQPHDEVLSRVRYPGDVCIQFNFFLFHLQLPSFPPTAWRLRRLRIIKEEKKIKRYLD